MITMKITKFLLLFLFASFQINSLNEVSGQAVIQAVEVDTCMLREGDNFGGSVSRAVTFEEAGREGLAVPPGGKLVLRANNSLTAEAYKVENTPIVFGYKFLADLGPKPHETIDVANFGEVLYLQHTAENKISLGYVMLNEQDEVSRKQTEFEIPPECVDYSEDVDRDATGEPIGLKLRITLRKKRSTDDDSACWKLLGLKYFFDRKKNAYLAFFINGVELKRLSFSTDEDLQLFLMKQPTHDYLQLENGKFSCLEFIQADDHNLDFYENINLTECRKKYEDEPEQKYVNCNKYS